MVGIIIQLLLAFGVLLLMGFLGLMIYAFCFMIHSLKADSVRANMIVDHLFRTMEFVEPNKGYSFTWSDKKLCEILELAYPKRYANRLAELGENEDGNN